MRICIFSSSRDNIGPMMIEEARRLGAALAEASFELVFGGANQGAMGAMANACLKGGGKVHGVFPEKELVGEIEHSGLTQMIRVENMSVRKQKLIEISDAFVVFPGGTGTLDEFFEVLVLKQLASLKPEHSERPMILLNAFGFWDPLVELLQIYQQQGFIDPEASNHYHVESDVEGTIAKLQSYT